MSWKTILVPVRAMCEGCTECDHLSLEGLMEYDPATKRNTTVWACKRLEFCLDVRATLATVRTGEEKQEGGK